MRDATDALARFLDTRARVVVFTGAGVSTESGIPDFRSPGGVWTRYDPRELTFDRYVASAEVRGKSWAMRREFFAAGARPNPAHVAIADLERAGRSPGVITQNIDGLHREAGSDAVVEIHGTAATVTCIGAAPRHGRPDGCGFSEPTSWAFEQIDAGVPDPRCPRCEGLVKSATISFGQAMDPSSLEAAQALFDAADAMLVVGSSLQVYPAASFPELAIATGMGLAIVNDEPTPFDAAAETVVRGRAAEVLPVAVASALRVPPADR